MAGAESMTRDLNSELKTKLRERRALIVPGAANALAARVIEDIGFEAVYITGAGVTTRSWRCRIWAS
jgi:2-methylisocitrate lyase-like PEP mutase family enzyme